MSKQRWIRFAFAPLAALILLAALAFSLGLPTAPLLAGEANPALRQASVAAPLAAVTPATMNRMAPMMQQMQTMMGATAMTTTRPMYPGHPGAHMGMMGMMPTMMHPRTAPMHPGPRPEACRQAMPRMGRMGMGMQPWMDACPAQPEGGSSMMRPPAALTNTTPFAGPHHRWMHPH